MRLFILTCIQVLTALSLPQSAGDGFCGERNKTFKAGEKITYKIYYTLAGAFVLAGEAGFNTVLERLNGKAVYHITGEGRTFSFYDNFYKVRDRYETYIDTASLEPYKFIRNVYEGGYKKYENVTFDKASNTAVTHDGVFKVPPCVQDVLSAIYAARNIDFSKLKPGDKVPFEMFLDNRVYPLYIRYMGKEIVKTKYGRFRSIKFKPLLIKGTIFEGGEKMTVWASDDANHIPLRVESPITIGSIKADMMDFRNRRYPLSSLLDVR